jgi:hypothetical protein
MTVGRSFRQTHTFDQKPEPDWIPQVGDILVSPKAFYLVHSCHRVKSKTYPYRYSVLQSRISSDDEAIASSRKIQVCSADKAFLERAKLAL